MLQTLRHLAAPLALWLAFASAALSAADWPQWGGHDGRNMVSDEKGLPASFEALPPAPGKAGEPVDGHVKWMAKLGSETCGSPTVAGGKVFIGTNNASPRDAKYTGDFGVLMCFDEATGKFLWQLCVPKLPAVGPANMDFARLGISSSPTVEGKFVYVVTNRCEVLCLDVNGLADGNDGPFVDEAAYLAPPLKQALDPSFLVAGKAHKVKPGTPTIRVTPAAQPLKLGPADADVVWRYDMLNTLGIWPQDASNCSILIHGDLLYVGTSNGVDKSHTNIPAPDAPMLIVLDKKTGKLVAVDDSKASARLLHGSWSSPSLGRVGDQDLVFFGGPDGVCYAFDATVAAGVNGGPGVLRKYWDYDCNPPAARFKDRASARYPRPGGPSEIIATPVFYQDRVYVTVGQDPRHRLDPGVLSCIDATQRGNVTDKAKVWEYRGINRSLSTVSIAGGLVYAADVAGAVHCLDAQTGKPCWVQQTNAEIWGSTLVADGKVFIGTGKGELWTLAAGRQLKVLGRTVLGAPMHATPVVANGVLYLAANTRLYAVQAGK